MWLEVYSRIACERPEKASIEKLPDLLKAHDKILWLDMTGPEAEGIQLMHDVFQFHPLAIEDSHNQRQRPKVEEYPNHLFTILNPITGKTDEGFFNELDIFVGNNYIVTVHSSSEPVVDEARRRVHEACELHLMSPGYLLYALVDTVVDNYFPALDAVGDEIADLEERVYQNPKQEFMERVFRLKRLLSEMWRVAAQQRDMFSILLRDKSVFIDDDLLRFYMRDVYDHLILINDTVNTYRDNLNSVVELYMFASSARLNSYVNRLTVITICIGILTVVSGFYGMNFLKTWPPFEAEWGVPFVLVVMLGLMGIVIAFIRWIRQRAE